MNSYYREEQTSLPVIPLRGLFMFPHMVMHFDVGRPRSIAALEAAMMSNGEIFVVTQKNFMLEEPEKSDLYTIGTVATIKQTLKLSGGVIRVLVEGVERGRLLDLEEKDGYYEADLMRIEYDENIKKSKEMTAAMRLILSDMKTFIAHSKDLGEEILMGLRDIDDPGRLADVIGSYVSFSEEGHQEILAELDPYLRLTKLHKLLNDEIELLKIEEKINKKVVKAINDSQREYYLKEQMQAIREELGEAGDDEEAVENYKKKLEALTVPDEVREKIEKEIRALSHTPPQSPENTVIRNYLDIVFDLPWNEVSTTEIDLAKARKILDRDHYGLKDVKERILEFIALMKRRNTVKGPILCLVGPPGVGKTSIAHSIAEALGREFVRMSLGGVRDEAEIRGHRKTYIGAMPGRIISELTKAKTRNPLFLLDEIDKLSGDFRGDPANALLEVLDPAQNDTFTDHYLEIPFDLSDVVFLTTANFEDDIPEPLFDRMEVIRLTSYTDEEKFQIAKRHLLPRVKENHGLEKKELSVSDAAIREIIEFYTREAGVRELERNLSKIARRAVKRLVEEEAGTIKVGVRNLTDFLGKKKYFPDDFDKVPQVGIVTGLAWTSVGGVLLTIEASPMPGTGKVQLTGSLGDVMKESAMACISYIRSHAAEWKIPENFYKEMDIHIHLPEGATPKDGPSAGVTMTTALVSALTGKRVRRDIAMTGEMTLRGKVLPIGGLKEKALAAYRYGIKTVFIPADNVRDLDEIPEKIREKMHFIPVKEVHEILREAFIDEN